jgi:glycerophosphoryl diester phosphodiesterase
MIIISHRGYWHVPQEKNTAVAFARSFALGFGTETDVRDRGGELVIAHDMATTEDMRLEQFLEIYGKCGLPLAFNIKADGLAAMLHRLLERFQVENYFVFDCAVPDLREHLKKSKRVYTRMSEVEVAPAWMNEAHGVWLDAFDSDWFGTDVVQSILDRERKVCVVSSELHGREPSALWATLLPFAAHPNVMLCTDWPEQAQAYFNKVIF